MTASGLRTFRCRVRARGSLAAVECVAPSAQAAAYAVALPGLTGGTEWVQVVVAEWSGVLGEFIEPGDALIVSRHHATPDGTDSVVISRIDLDKDNER